MNFNRVVCHYAEIGLKKGNRGFFEKKLADNIKTTLQNQAPDSFESVQRISGRILIKLKEGNLPPNILKNIFGLAYFAFAIEIKQNIEAIKTTAFDLLKKKKFKTFKISAKRAEKKFPLNSQQINEKIGEFIVEKLKKRVDLENPEITVFIEIVDKYAFLYLEKIKGPGGLPAGTAGKALALISGGIDSPVAARFIQKRGAEIIFLHFHSYPYTAKTPIERVKKLIKILNKYRQKSKVYFTPFADIQRKIVSETSNEFERLRVILYRRFMMKIAEKIAEKENALALVTGEAVGQVASQTLKNIKVIEEAVKIPILRPLIGFDKEEIIEKAKNIGTYETSIAPCEDTCSLFAPSHPETMADLKTVKFIEKKLEVKKIISQAIKKSEIIFIE